MAVVAPASLGFRAFFFRLPRSPPCLPELSVSPARPLAATRCGANGLCRAVVHNTLHPIRKKKKKEMEGKRKIMPAEKSAAVNKSQDRQNN